MTKLLIPAVLLATASLALAQTTRPSGSSEAAPPEQVFKSLLQPQAPGAQPLQPVNEPPAVDATTGKNAVAPGAPTLNVMREGTYIVDRLGRSKRTSEGQMEFTFDADGQAMQDPPVFILPNLNLMRMENAVTGSSRDLKFRITGMVTEYHGRNYVLLEKVIVVTDTLSAPTGK